MLTDPRFWLYLILFFTSAACMRFLLNSVRKKRSVLVSLYIASAAASSAILWIFTPGFIFSSFQEGLIFCLSAIVPGFLAGVHLSFLILPFIAVIFLSWFLNAPLAPPLYRDKAFLGTLTFYPTQKGKVFYEWRGAGLKIELGTLAGTEIAPIIRRERLPDYLFFLESSWGVVGLLSENLPVSQLPVENSETVKLLPLPDKKDFSLMRYDFPALRFMDPGYFNSYTFVIKDNRELMIIESKQQD